MFFLCKKNRSYLSRRVVAVHTGLDDLMVDIVESQDDQELLALRVSDFLYEISEI